MIYDFEKYTEDFTKDLLDHVEIIVENTKNRIGKKKAITSAELRKILYNRGYSITEPNFRRCIQYIRATKSIQWLCASQKGYYVAENEEQWTQYRVAFRSRITSMQFTLACME